jgi:hypothetical protein
MNDNEKPPLVKLAWEDRPELLQAIAAQYAIDREEAGPKLPVDRMQYRGLVITSRYAVASEFPSMRAVLDALPDLARARIVSIWCDSQAGSDYTVKIAENRWIPGLDAQIRDAFVAATAGFNGIFIDCGNARGISFDPWWLGDED